MLRPLTKMNGSSGCDNLALPVITIAVAYLTQQLKTLGAGSILWIGILRVAPPGRARNAARNRFSPDTVSPFPAGKVRKGSGRTCRSDGIICVLCGVGHRQEMPDRATLAHR
jgi:hypothetical protein